MRDDDFPSILVAAVTLIVVLLGSLVLALTYLTEDDQADAGPPSGAMGGPGVQGPPSCQEPDSCRVASRELRTAYNDARACDGAGDRICLVPMGDVPKDIVDMIVQHYRREYGLTLRVLKPLDLRNGFDRGTQLDEALVHSQLIDSYRSYALDRSVTLIGIVPIDLYLGDRPATAYSLGRLKGEVIAGVSREIDYRSGLLSIFRMEPHNSGLPADQQLRDDRIRKMVSKIIAHSYFGLQAVEDPTSVLYRDVQDLTQLDRLTERIPGR